MSELCFQDRLLPGFHTYTDNIAIRYGAKKVTYRELDIRSESILNWLLENDIRKESFVGIYIEDKIDFISAMVGIIKAGCVFVPLYTGLPVKRIENMIRTTHTAIIFSDEGNRERLYRHGGDIPGNLRIVTVNDSFYGSHGVGAAAGAAIQYSREDKIYIYFTSGSTGTPKAVVGKNKSLLHFIDWEISTFSVGEAYRVSQLNSPECDAFLRDIFVPLCAGAAVCIPDGNTGEMTMNSHQLVDWVDRNQIHLIHCVPGVFRLFNSDGAGVRNFTHLKYILLAGDRLNPPDLKKWYAKFDERIQLVNLYGPTETTMVKTFYFIDKKKIARDRIPIGKPMKGSRVLILDKQLNICGEKTIGEIYIRTPYGTFGYYNDPGLTSQRFIPNPFTGDANDLFYKTGDLGRMLPDGNIEFVGRIDRQLKIKGIRVEPEEIENTILTHPAIVEAVITELEDSNGETYLCAYYVSRETIESAELTDYLAAVLPPYMIPSRFVRIEKVPLLPGGKIDFKALPVPGAITGETGSGVPGDEIERTLVKIWSDVLEIEEHAIGVHDFFTDLDGQSLKAIMISSWIHKEFNVSIPIHAIFELSTIRRLAEYIKKSVEDKFHSIEPTEEKVYYPLSPGQKRLYIIKRMAMESIGYNVPQIAALEGNLDIKKLEDTFDKLIHRHESFRTSFKLVGNEPVQEIHKRVDFRIEFYNPGEGSGMPHGPAAVNEIIKNFIRSFDLEQAPLLRVGLIHTPRAGAPSHGEQNSEDKYILMTDMHHIISDAASRRILLEDFLDLYEGKELPDLRLRYRDYSEWVNSPGQRQVIKQQEIYWLEQFAGELPVLNLPIDFPRPKVQNFEGGLVGLEIGKKETTALQKLAMEENATLYMVLLALFNVFLAKLSGQEDIVVGTAVVGRRHTDLEKIVGIFINTLALRNYPREEKTFKEFLRDLRQRSFNAFENQHYPFEDLVDRLSVKRDMSRNPLCDVMFAYQEVKENTRAISPRSLSLSGQDPYHEETVISKFDLLLGAAFAENLYLSFEYGSKLFKRETIERFLAYLKNVLLQIPDKPDIKLAQIEIISEKEKNQVLYDFNHTDYPYPEDKTIHELFEEQVERTRGRIAIVGSWQLPVGRGEISGESETVQLTYGELKQKSDQLARLLREKGVRTESIAGIMMGRSTEMIIAILAILKAGGAYLPIDPDFPQERIYYILEDSGAKLLVTTDNKEGEKVRRWEGEIYSFSSVSSVSSVVKNLLPAAGHRQPATSLAYVIYTSGTTGRPKGVLIQHQGVVNMVWFHRKVFNENPGSRISQAASAVFDAMAFEMWPCLLAGACLCIVDNETRMHSTRLKEWLIRHQVTISFQPTSIARGFLEEQWPETGTALEVLRTAGDRLTCHPTRLFPFRFYNLYGPTEDTIWTTWTEVPAISPGERNHPPSIGRPVGNKQVYILNAGLKLQPVGVAGELCIAGDSLSRGYLNNPELTAEKFIEYRTYRTYRAYISSERIYKTGDLARWLPEGDIDFLGRIDHQVKIRGYRVELGEIEAGLLKRKGIKEAVVIDRERENGDKYLCAYIVPDFSGWDEGLREFLSHSLPDYMIPSYFTALEKIPLTPNGKIDRRSLPEPQLKAGESYVAPGNEIEEKLVGLWAEILDIERNVIGIDSNFFRLGGHSLKASVMADRVLKELNVRLPLVEIFETPTIRELAKYIMRGGMGTVTSKNDNLVLLKPVPRNTNHLFLIHDGTGEVEGYIEFCKHLSAQFNYWGLRADRLENLAPRNFSIEALARKYIKEIQKVQPPGQGCYYIMGWSLGGTIAFEIVSQLEQMNEKINLLALVDSPPPFKKTFFNRVFFNRMLFKDTGEFNLESEFKFLQAHSIIGSEIQETFKKVTGLDRFWLAIAEYLETSNYDVGIIKKMISAYGMQALPNYNRLNIRESIYYLNVGRTLRNARALYTPPGKIHTPVHYFAASRSKKIDRNQWNQYSQTPIKSYEITGDHLSIFKMPDVAEFAKLFDEILKIIKNKS